MNDHESLSIFSVIVAVFFERQDKGDDEILKRKNPWGSLGEAYDVHQQHQVAKPEDASGEADFENQYQWFSEGAQIL